MAEAAMQRGAGFGGHSSLHEYFAATFEDKLLRQHPDEAADVLTPASQLLAKQREKTEVEQALSSEKEAFDVTMETLQQRRVDLEAREQELADSLLKFDKFLKENEARRKRAAARQRDEAEQTRLKMEESRQLAIQLHQMRAQRAVYAQVIERQSTFEAYLSGVLEAMPEHTELTEIIDRHATLTIASKELREREQSEQRQLDSTQAEATAFKEESRVAQLNSNNKLAALQTELEERRAEALLWQNKLTKVQTGASKRTLLLGRIKMATSNLSQLVDGQKRASAKRSKPLSTAEQLAKVQRFMQDLQDIAHLEDEGV